MNHRRRSNNVSLLLILMLLLNLLSVGTPLSAEQNPDNLKYALSGETVGEGTVRGRIIDQATKKSIESALVVLTDGQNENQYQTTTDTFGMFKITNINAGTYTIEASHPGFHSASEEDYLVEENRSSNWDKQLVPKDTYFDFYMEVSCVKTGLQLENVPVTITVTPTEGGDNIILSGYTDETGFLHFPNASSGFYHFYINKGNYHVRGWESFSKSEAEEIKGTNWADILLKPNSLTAKVLVRGFDPVLELDNRFLGGVTVEAEGLALDDHDLVLVPAQIGVSGIFKQEEPGWNNDMWGYVEFNDLMAIDWRFTGKRLGYHESERIIEVNREFGILPFPNFELQMHLQDTKITAKINTPYGDQSLGHGLKARLKGLKDTNTEGIDRTRTVQYQEDEGRAVVVFDKILPGNYLLTVDDKVTKTVPIIVDNEDVQSNKSNPANRFSVHFKGMDYVDAFADTNHEVELFLEPQPLTFKGTLETTAINTAKFVEHGGEFSKAVEWDVKAGQKVEIRASEYYAQYMPEESRHIEVQTDNTGTFSVSLLPGLYGFAMPELDGYFGAALTLDDVDKGTQSRRMLNWPYYQAWPHSRDSLVNFLGLFNYPFTSKYSSGHITPGGVGGIGLSSGENLAGYFLLNKKEFLLDMQFRTGGMPSHGMATEIFKYGYYSSERINGPVFYYEGTDYFSVTGPEEINVAFNTTTPFSPSRYQFSTLPILITIPGTYTMQFNHPDAHLVRDQFTQSFIINGDTFIFLEYPNPGVLPAAEFPEDYDLHGRPYYGLAPLSYLELYGDLASKVSQGDLNIPAISIYSWDASNGNYKLENRTVNTLAYQYSALNNRVFSNVIPSALAQPYSRFVSVSGWGEAGYYKLHSEEPQKIYSRGPTPTPRLEFDPEDRSCIIGINYEVSVEVRNVHDPRQLLHEAVITYDDDGFVQEVSLPGWKEVNKKFQYSNGKVVYTVYMEKSNYLEGQIINKDTGAIVPHAVVTVISPQGRRDSFLAAENGTFRTTAITGDIFLDNVKHLLEIHAPGFEPYRSILDPAQAVAHPDFNDRGLFFLTGDDTVKLTPLPRPVIHSETLTMDRWGAFLPGVKKSGNQSVFNAFDADGPLTMTWTLEVAPGQQEYSFTLPDLEGSTETLVIKDELAEVWLIDRKAFPTHSYDEDYQSITIAENLEPHAFREILKNIREEKTGFKNVYHQRLNNFDTDQSGTSPGTTNVTGQIKLWQLPPDLFQPAFVAVTKMGAVNVYNFDYSGDFAGKELTGARLPAWFAGMADIMGTIAGSEALLGEGILNAVPKGKLVPLPSFTANIVLRVTGALDYVYSIDTKITEGVSNDKGGILGFAPGLLGMSIYGGAEATLKGEDREFYLQLKGGISPASIQEKDYAPNMLKKLGVEVKLVPPPAGEFYHIDSYVFDADNKPHELAVLYGMSGQLGLEMAKDITPIIKYIPKAGPILYKISEMTDLQIDALVKALGGVRSLSGFKTTFPHQEEHYYEYTINGETNQLRRHFLGGDEVGDPVQDSDPDKTESLDIALGFGLGLRVEALKRLGAQGTFELAGDDAWTGAPAMLVDINPHGDYPIIERVRGDLRAVLTAYIKAWIAKYQKQWTWKAWPIDYQFGTESVMYLIELEISEQVKGLTDYEPVEFTGETPLIIDKYLPLGVYKPLSGSSGSIELLMFSDLEGLSMERMSLQVATKTAPGAYNQPVKIAVADGGIITADIMELSGGGWLAVWSEIDQEDLYQFYPGTKIMYSLGDGDAVNWTTPAMAVQLDTEVAEYLRLISYSNSIALVYAKTGDGPVGGDYTIQYIVWDDAAWSEPEELAQSITLTDFDATGSDGKIHVAYTDSQKRLSLSTWSQGNPITLETSEDVSYSIALAQHAGQTCLAYSGKEGGIGLYSYDEVYNTWTDMGLFFIDARPLELSLAVVYQDGIPVLTPLWTQRTDSNTINLYYAVLDPAGTLVQDVTGITDLTSGEFHSPGIYFGTVENRFYQMGVYEENELSQLHAYFMGDITPDPLQKYTLTVETEGMGTTVPAEGAHIYDEGANVPLQATPADGWRFRHWMINDSVVSNANTTITMDADKTTIAHFEQTDDATDECFIATAAYGSKMAPGVAVLRKFRDAKLLNNLLGQTFVRFYYQVSPHIAEYIAGNEGLKLWVKTMLLPVITFAYIIMHPWLLLLVVSLVVLYCRKIPGRELKR